MSRWATAILVCCTPAAALAQSAAPAQDSPQDNSRFVFHEVDDGIMRFDTRLGEISLCSRQTAGWTCRIVPDERAALDAEIARLQQENAALRKALAPRGDSEPSAGDKPAAPAPPPAAKPAEPERRSEPLVKWPSAEDLARARAAAGLIWQRLVEMMAHLREDFRERI